MALVNVTNIVVLDNPTSFTNPFTFEVTFECLQALEADLEWKVLYVSSAEDAEQDQVLEEVMVGPVPVGVNKFVLQSDAPEVGKIPEEDIIGVTVILITCSYRDQEFVRVGYYVNNEYTEEYDPENPPRPIDINKLQRNILADKPRVTRFAIDWGGQGERRDDGLGPLPTEETMEGMAGDMAGDEDDEGEDALEEAEDDDEEDDEDDEGDGEEETEEDAAAAMDLASPMKQHQHVGGGMAMSSPMGSG